MSVDKELMVVIKTTGIGEEPDLGERLLKAFLKMLLESGQIPEKMLFMDRGIFLTTEGSAYMDLLDAYDKAGCELLSCGTCLDYYGRREKLAVGKPTNMRDTVQALLHYKRILQP